MHIRQVLRQRLIHLRFGVRQEQARGQRAQLKKHPVLLHLMFHVFPPDHVTDCDPRIFQHPLRRCAPGWVPGFRQSVQRISDTRERRLPDVDVISTEQRVAQRRLQGVVEHSRIVLLDADVEGLHQTLR